MKETDERKNTVNPALERGRNSKGRKEEEKRSGFGDKKLEGPNRPSV